MEHMYRIEGSVIEGSGLEAVREVSIDTGVYATSPIRAYETFFKDNPTYMPGGAETEVYTQGGRTCALVFGAGATVLSIYRPTYICA